MKYIIRIDLYVSNFVPICPDRVVPGLSKGIRYPNLDPYMLTGKMDFFKILDY